MSPRVSVLMTIYNAAPYLARSIDSLMRQSFGDWELLAVENGSADGSAAILASYDDARIRALPLAANIGRTPALRLAFENARGEYIAVLDADDTSDVHRFREQVRFLDTRPEVALLGTWARFIDAADTVIGEWTPSGDPAALRQLMGSENPIVHSSAMYRAEAARAVGGYPLEASFGQDLALWLNLLAQGEPAVLTEFLSSFRVLPASMTRNSLYRIDAARDKLVLLRRAAAQLQLVGVARRRNREEIAIARTRYAVALLKSGHTLRGFGAALAALCADPLHLLNNRLTRGIFRQP